MFHPTGLRSARWKTTQIPQVAGKRPMPADCSNRADLAAAVEEFYEARSGRIEPATTSQSPTA
jgi:hypothetical protein